jgi:chromosome partitioning protein
MADPRDFIVSTEVSDIVPSNNSLKDIERDVVDGNRFGLLKRCLAPVEASYDFILFDCPPSFNAFTRNALAAADEYIVPVDVGYFAMLGLKQLLEEVERIKRELNPGLRLAGVLASKFDKRTTLSGQVLETLRDSFPGAFFKTAVRVNIDLVRAQIANESIFKFNSGSSGAKDFRALAKEILYGQEK